MVGAENCVSDLMVLLARTAPRDKVKRRTEGLSVFLIDCARSLDAPRRFQPGRGTGFIIGVLFVIFTDPRQCAAPRSVC